MKVRLSIYLATSAFVRRSNFWIFATSFLLALEGILFSSAARRLTFPHECNMPPPTKRRRTEPTVVEEISFDLTARQEYLTGFHKRKLQRAKHAQEAAGKRARAEKLEDRKLVRIEVTDPLVVTY